MSRIGFIGLGNIGSAIAHNLLEDGHELAVHDLVDERVAALAAAGATPGADPAGVARRAEITLLSLPSPDAVDSVAELWLDGAAADQVLVDLSTNAPSRVRALAQRVEAAGCGFLDAPVTGGVVGAQARTLMFMVGGDAQVFARVSPLFESLGRATCHMGATGAGMVGKLVNSCIAFTTTWASLEALALGIKAGIDLRRLVEMLRTGGAGNFYLEHMIEGIGVRGAPTQFALELAAKDAGLILDLAREHGVPTPIASSIAQVLVSAVGAGLGPSDWSELPGLLERQSGMMFDLAPPAGKE